MSIQRIGSTEPSVVQMYKFFNTFRQNLVSNIDVQNRAEKLAKYNVTFTTEEPKQIRDTAAINKELEFCMSELKGMSLATRLRSYNRILKLAIEEPIVKSLMRSNGGFDLLLRRFLRMKRTASYNYSTMKRLYHMFMSHACRCDGTTRCAKINRIEANA